MGDVKAAAASARGAGDDQTPDTGTDPAAAPPAPADAGSNPTPLSTDDPIAASADGPASPVAPTNSAGAEAGMGMWEKLRSRVGPAFSTVWAWTKSYGLAAATAILALVVVLLWVRPFDPAIPPQKDVATLWSESISRLGIEPLFPPQEDFNVGDVYAVIAAYDEAGGDTREQQPNRPLLRKSVRIGHIDLRPFSKRPAGTPRFPLTKPNGDKMAVGLDQAREEETATAPANDKVDVTFVSFPSLTISDNDTISGGDDNWLPFGGRRTLHSKEEITIGMPESYGASAPEAIVALDQWCEAENTRLYCSDAVLRKILSYTTDPGVLQVRANKYVYRIDLKLITRVYMMRNVNFNRSTDGSVDAAVGGSGSSGQPPTSEPPQADAAAATGAERDIDMAVFRSGRRSELTLAMGQVIFPRPVAFGFKSVTFALDRSEPEPAPAAPTLPK
jgi:hypothetical protein